MPISNDKKYVINGEPVTTRELIKEAMSMSESYRADCLKTTSEAARILRDNGNTVEDFKP